MRPGPLPLPVRVAAWRARRPALLLLVTLVVAAGVRLGSPVAPTVPVVVAAHDVAPDQPLAREDLTVARLPPHVAPVSGHAAPEALLGRTVALPVPAGLPLVEEVMAAERFTLAPPAGSVVVVVELSAAALLRVGDRIDLVTGSGWPAGTAGEPTVLAVGALVLQLPPGGTDTPWNPLGTTTTAAAGVLVAVDPAEGHRIAAVVDAVPLGAVLVG